MRNPSNSNSIDSRGGKGNINNTGDRNAFVNCDTYIDLKSFERKPLNRTALFTFCDYFSNLDSLEDNDIPLTNPSKFAEKMNYNELVRYKQTFEDCDIYYNEVEIVLSQFSRREKIPNTINKVYNRILDTHPNFISDEICSAIAKELLGIISNDDRSLNSELELDREDFELAIDALMYYTFTKCKILKPVPKTTNEEE